MLEPTDPDAPLPPAQPAEEFPDWIEDQRPARESLPSTADADPDQPPAATLADKHKARRKTASQRLLLLTPEAPVETPYIASEQDAPSPDAPVETQNIAPVQDAPAATTFPQETLLEGVKAFPRRAWQRTSDVWARIVQRVRFGPGAGTRLEDRAAWDEPASASEPTQREEPLNPDEPLSSVEPLSSDESVSLDEPIQPVVLPPQRGAFNDRAARTWAYMRPILWRGRIGPAFWTVASLLSLTVNIILIVILILLGRQLFFLKNTVISDKLINGLYDNFALMDQAHIKTTILVSDTIQVKDTIQVNDTIPVVFDLPLNQKTVVVLTQDTEVKNATIYLNDTAVPLDLILRQGTELSIKLDMNVPVNTTIPVVIDVPVVLNVPVNLVVPVDIPLDKTELHKPFVGLQKVVSPYRQLLGGVPDSWSAVCKGPLKVACTILGFK